MIFIQPLILASEFVTHAVLIVLAGVTVVEYVVWRRHIEASIIRKRAFYAVAAMTALGAVWVFMDYFGWFDISFLGFLRYILLLAIVACVFYLAWMVHHVSGVVRMPGALGIALAAIIFVFMASDILYQTTGMPSAGLFYALFRIIGVSVYYFFIMGYFIKNNTYGNA